METEADSNSERPRYDGQGCEVHVEELDGNSDTNEPEEILCEANDNVTGRRLDLGENVGRQDPSRGTGENVRDDEREREHRQVQHCDRVASQLKKLEVEDLRHVFEPVHAMSISAIVPSVLVHSVVAGKRCTALTT